MNRNITGNKTTHRVIQNHPVSVNETEISLESKNLTRK